MAAKGTYELALTCDNTSGERCQKNLTITDSTRAGAKQLARNNGWFVDRYGGAYCPEHRDRPRVWKKRK